MRKLTLICLFTLAIISCKKQETNPTGTTNQTINNPSGSNQKHENSFFVSSTVDISPGNAYPGKYTIVKFIEGAPNYGDWYPNDSVVNLNIQGIDSNNFPLTISMSVYVGKSQSPYVKGPYLSILDSAGRFIPTDSVETRVTRVDDVGGLIEGTYSGKYMYITYSPRKEHWTQITKGMFSTKRRK